MPETRISQYQVFSVILLILSAALLLMALWFFIRAAGGIGTIAGNIAGMFKKKRVPGAAVTAEEQIEAFREIMNAPTPEEEESDPTMLLKKQDNGMFRIRKKIIITHDEV